MTTGDNPVPPIDPLTAAKTTAAIVREVMATAGDNPKVREAGSELGKTALTITKTINVVLLPLAAVNFAFDKARTYFEGQFQRDIADKTASIPLEEMVEPKASIAGPALQGLAFAHEEPDLKALYLGLLASAMDGRIAASAHPAFVEIIRQLDAAEASLLNGLFRLDTTIPIAEIRLQKKDPAGFQVLLGPLADMKNTETGQAAEEPRFAAMTVNWTRLGLVSVEYGRYLVRKEAYDWVESRPELSRLREEHEKDGNTVVIEKGILAPTALGRQWAEAVGIIGNQLLSKPQSPTE